MSESSTSEISKLEKALKANGVDAEELQKVFKSSGNPDEYHTELKRMVKKAGMSEASTVKSSQFQPMKGHVADGTVVIFPSKNKLVVTPASMGWTLNDGKKVVAGPFDSAMELTTWIDRNEEKY